MKNSPVRNAESATPNAKYCPQCQRLCPLTARACRDCGHRFRTKFAAPVSRPDRPSLRVRLQNLPENALRWQAAHQSQIDASKGPLGWAAIVVVGILLLVHPFGVTSKSTSPGVAPVQADAPKSVRSAPPAAHASSSAVSGKARSKTAHRRAKKAAKRN